MDNSNESPYFAGPGSTVLFVILFASTPSLESVSVCVLEALSLPAFAFVSVVAIPAAGAAPPAAHAPPPNHAGLGLLGDGDGVGTSYGPAPEDGDDTSGPDSDASAEGEGEGEARTVSLYTVWVCSY